MQYLHQKSKNNIRAIALSTVSIVLCLLLTQCASLKELLGKTGVNLHYLNGMYSKCNETEVYFYEDNIYQKVDGRFVKVNTVEMMPDGIVAAEDGSYYLLFGRYMEDEKDVICTVKKYRKEKFEKEYRHKNITSLAYKDGILFFGIKLIKGLPLNRRYSDLNVSGKGFNANYYVREEDFGEKLKDVSDLDFRSLGLYQYDGYVSTERNYHPDNVLYDWGEDSMSEYSVFKWITRKMDIKVLDKCTFYQYRDGEKIYGICNEGNGIVTVNPYFSSDLKKTYMYVWDLKKDEFEVVCEMDKVLFLYGNADYIAYVENNSIYKKDLKTEEKQKIHDLAKKTTNLYIEDERIIKDDENGVDILCLS